MRGRYSMGGFCQMGTGRGMDERSKQMSEKLSDDLGADLSMFEDNELVEVRADVLRRLEAELALLRRAMKQLTNSNMIAASDLCHRLMAANGVTTGQAWDYLSSINIIHWERGIPRAPKVAPDILELIKNAALPEHLRGASR